MEVIYVTDSSKQINSEPHIMAIGFFDGVHLGHQELLKRARTLAEKDAVPFTAMTFSPHPDEVIKGETDREYLTPLPQKIEKMAAMGVDKLFVMRFDRTFASLPPTDFINDYIVRIHTKHVVVGFDFTFGFKAQGNTELLRRESRNQFGLSIIPKKTYLNKKISSTLLRELIGNGEVDMVPYYLGTSHQVKVKVKAGQQSHIGSVKVKTIGNYILPKPGMYHVKVSDGETTVHGTFHRYDDREMDYELDVNGLTDCLNKELSVEFLNKLSEARSISV